MWACVHTMVGAILSKRLEGRSVRLKYPLLAFACTLAHLYLDNIPFVWRYHVWWTLPLGIQLVVYLWNAGVMLTLLYLDRRAAIEGAVFGWLLVDWEHLLGWRYMHSILDYAGRLPYGGVWLELAWATSLLAIAAPIEKLRLGKP